MQKEKEKSIQTMIIHIPKIQNKINQFLMIITNTI